MTKNRFKVVMLPTEKAIEIKSLCKHSNNGICIITNAEHLEFVNDINKEIVDTYVPQHLYIVDTEATIEVGDWYVDKRIVASPILSNTPIHEMKKSACIKAVASSNKSLGLLTLPKQFIQEYIAEPFEYVPEKYICRKCGGLAIDSKALMNYHYIDKSYHRGEVEFETKLEDCLKCSSCGNSWVNDKNKLTREQAFD